jgi:succinate-semialdehyde dehydrogenase/glutarate-semialdehyde dehydrogenase
MSTSINALSLDLEDKDLLRQESFVDGHWVSSNSGKRFDITDPGTGNNFASCPDMDVSDVDAAIQSSARAFKTYRQMTPRQRAKILMQWYNLIMENKDDLAMLLTYENGKPLKDAHDEIDYASGFVWWFSGEAERIFGTINVPALPNRRVFVHKQPIGVCVALVPWNLPIAMILRKAGAAFAAGCTMVVKPSTETPLTCLTLAYLATKAGLPAGVFNVLTTSHSNTATISEAMCKHPLVRKVTFTGSTKIGAIISKHCAEGVKKVTMELGGNCPFIVFDDADLEHAVSELMVLKWRHVGQACITANRVYVQAGIYDEFARQLKKKTETLVQGHGAAPGTTFGAMAVARGVEKAESLVKDAIDHGATLISGGKGSTDHGFYFQPTILTGMKPNMRIADEEVFGPVLGIFKFETEAEVVERANDTSMGLASYAFTNDVNRLWRMLENLEAGMIGMVSQAFLPESYGAIITHPFAWSAEHWPFLCGRISIRWNQRERTWEGKR